MITENTNAQKSQQHISTGFQPKTQAISVNLNPNMNNEETTEKKSPAQVTGSSIPTSSAVIPNITIQLQVPTKTQLKHF